MKTGIEVRVGGRGIVCGDEVREDAAVHAACTFCGADDDAVASVAGAGGPPAFACANCLRGRLEAITLGRWRLREARGGLPWGKISG